MSREEYDEMDKRQKGKCAICDIKPGPLHRGLGVDHCHKTRKIRGLLCGNCNRRVLGPVEKIGFERIASYLGYKIYV